MDFENSVDVADVVDDAKKGEVDEETTATEEELEPQPLPEAAASSVDEEASTLEPEPIAPPSPPPVAVTSPEADDTMAHRPVKSEGSLRWLWGGLIGGGIGAVLGVIITLLILTGINGSLDYARSRTVSGIQASTQNLEADLGVLDTELDTLRDELEEVREQREALIEAYQDVQDQQAQLDRGIEILGESIVEGEDLGARVETVEAEIESLQQRIEALVEDNVTLRDDLNAETMRLENALAEETTQLQADLAADLAEETTRLQEEIDVVSETVSLMETSAGALTEAFEETDERIERIETFFDRLNGLLRDFFGMPMSEVIEEQP